MRPAAIIALIIIVCVYAGLRSDPAHQVDNEITEGGTTALKNNRSGPSSSVSNQVPADLEREQAESSMTDVVSSTTPMKSDATDIIIGIYSDPDDNGPVDREDRERISIGVVRDADNDEGWPLPANVTPITIGHALDASALGYEDSITDRESIAVGEPLDVERFLAGEYSNLSDQDRIPISVGEKIAVPK